ncbi:MAG: hypothetical protein E7267_02780 [Lachnospiraceae bacterium]|nr:hypothetical protein [Lachnospiraceae bacterium]
MKRLLCFLEELDKRKIYYRINKIRESILIEVAVPGQRWEVEFFEDDHVEIEKFISDGVLYGQDEIEVLFTEFAD